MDNNSSRDPLGGLNPSLSIKDVEKSLEKEIKNNGLNNAPPGSVPDNRSHVEAARELDQKKNSAENTKKLTEFVADSAARREAEEAAKKAQKNMIENKPENNAQNTSENRLFLSGTNQVSKPNSSINSVFSGGEKKPSETPEKSGRNQSISEGFKTFANTVEKGAEKVGDFVVQTGAKAFDAIVSGFQQPENNSGQPSQNQNQNNARSAMTFDPIKTQNNAVRNNIASGAGFNPYQDPNAPRNPQTQNTQNSRNSKTPQDPTPAMTFPGGQRRTLNPNLQQYYDNPANQPVKQPEKPLKPVAPPGPDPNNNPAPVQQAQQTNTAPEKPAVNVNHEKMAPAPKLSDMDVMEHTASIWQYKDIVDDGTEMHTEFDKKRITVPAAEIIGARVRGKKHKHEGTNCDDFFEIAVTDDCVIAVVCDGAGSKPLSRMGSRISSETAAAFLKEKLTELFDGKPEIRAGLCAELNSAEFMASCTRIALLLQESAKKAYEAQLECVTKISADEVYKKALGRVPVVNDLYTTFLAAVIVPLEIDGVRETFMACIQVGDGCLCALNSAADADSCLRLMGEADSGAFSGETDFLSEKNTAPQVLSAKTRISRGSSDTIMLMTDGVADDYFPAQPMMKRLFLDLSLNGILPMERGGYNAFSGEDPAPIRFKSVSKNQQSVALQYSKQLLSESSPDAMNALWNKRDALYPHSLDAFRINIGDTPEDRMCTWLDNYNERGSFDDRTLVVVRILPISK